MQWTETEISKQSVWAGGSLPSVPSAVKQEIE